ncbi:hypothetical protein SAMN05216215_1018132 [Saccharopolyspora shandongensis]|uniref:Uncharacterized protein n=1 Tax=Saccharopolyspora shandongensis TaxID=418495 RepID=A0A1H3GD28_9PSEU|nr:hypothetical protein [Saccharopolyspora shandongensis]SDY01186.1 hypothetical protein SAMN05216215_1018132 [Saccharopolyspora shandongensis]
MSAIRLLRRNATTALLVLSVWITLASESVQQRGEHARFDDTGSESTEKAVLTAIGLAAALGLGAAITAVVQKYQGQIH